MTKPLQMAIEIENPVFPRADVLAIVGSRAHWKKTAVDYGVPVSAIDKWMADGDVGMVVRVSSDGKFDGLMEFLPPCDWSLDWYQTLVHEGGHLVDECLFLHSLGDSIDTTQELRARLSEFYYAKVVSALRGVKPCTFKQRHFNYKGKYHKEKK